MLENSPDAIRLLNEKGFRVFITTNQSGIARRMFGVSELEAVHLKVVAMLAVAGATIHGIYYCPHHPDGNDAMYSQECGCRKPQPGMLEQAAREHDLDLKRSFMVGDTDRDLQAGKRAGAKSILVLTGKGKETKQDGADYVATDLLDAARWIAEQ